MTARVINGSDNIGANIQLRNYGFSIGREKIYSSQVQSADIITEENLIRSKGGGKSVVGALGWGTVGGIAFGPLGGLAGLVFGGRRSPKIISEKNICFALYLKDGRKYLIISDLYTFQTIKGMSFAQVQTIPQSYTAKVVNYGDNITDNQEYHSIQPVINKKDGLSKGKIILIVLLCLFGLSFFLSLPMLITKNSPAIAATSIVETTSPIAISDTPTTEIETVFNLSIANGAGVSGLSQKTAELFKKIKYPSGKDKYNITHITNADNYNYENTQIICKSEDSLIGKTAEDIKTILKVGVITTQNEISKDTDIAIIIGKDYTLPTEETTKTTPETTAETTPETTLTSNIAFEEIGMQGLFVFIYTESTKRVELQQIVGIYRNGKFKSKRIFELDFFNNREKALNAKTNFGTMLPDATYNYNANIGLDELRLYN